MEHEDYRSLAKVRMERAKELLIESKDLLDREAYKWANNRADYSIEKGVKALLATVQTDAKTHNGALKQFNLLFIREGDGSFTPEDYQKIAMAERIRNASDYDDFYIASKEETRQQITNAAYIVEKIDRYIANKQ